MFPNKILLKYQQVIIISLILCSFITFTNSINAEIVLSLESAGFHRTLNYKVNLKDFEQSNCHVALYFELPPAFYVNVDQISELVRREEITACSVGEIDVELFAENAGSQNVTVCSPLIGSEATLSLPIHQRYHYAREGGGYIEYKIPKAKLLLGCDARIKEHRVSKVKLCSPCFELKEKWREVPFNLFPEDFIWYVPVGDTLMLPIVTWVTNIVVMGGTLCVLWTIYKVNVLDERKQLKKQ